MIIGMLRAKIDLREPSFLLRFHKDRDRDRVKSGFRNTRFLRTKNSYGCCLWTDHQHQTHAAEERFWRALTRGV